MASIEEIEKERDFYDALMVYLPQNESQMDVPPANPTNNQEKTENTQKPKPQQQNKNVPKQKPKNKFNPIRPGFEGPKFIKKKREDRK
ncbi:hypothetical protein TVAG_484170 [Trichomonas vaginalis G3]|uniref:Uncharacterized protein n=1 Tax=Trichomonas vaginalis (strain ATCC PRA-98 / G3) TaxID=412133 RepID=A2EA60_TRIV3|nr:hypothetical protein TVAGG3_0980640 [Trichomonas vaginalis G3]EAY10506.1 hypothetical protein TVAG_484170 [Trichomonas vaginalis G3]KAI5489266.1 hypothetical protein TVAGG3_0980640 [Trichomonas vaginalis G3]|eukprot:XP_001322729.1 hypothetical protein [Trichomonas vaginalis G3]